MLERLLVRCLSVGLIALPFIYAADCTPGSLWWYADDPRYFPPDCMPKAKCHSGSNSPIHDYHLTLHVADVDATVKFYTHGLGLRVLFAYQPASFPGHTVAYLDHNVGLEGIETPFSSCNEFSRYVTSTKSLVGIFLEEPRPSEEEQAAAALWQEKVYYRSHPEVIFQVKTECETYEADEIIYWPNESYRHLGILVPNVTEIQERMLRLNATILKAVDEEWDAESRLMNRLGVLGASWSGSISIRESAFAELTNGDWPVFPPWTLEERQKASSFANADPASLKALFVEDPNGILLEILQKE